MNIYWVETKLLKTGIRDNETNVKVSRNRSSEWVVRKLLNIIRNFRLNLERLKGKLSVRTNEIALLYYGKISAHNFHIYFLFSSLRALLEKTLRAVKTFSSEDRIILVFFSCLVDRHFRHHSGNKWTLKAIDEI